MAEWSIAPVLKTGGLKGSGGSNPSLTAISATKKMLSSYTEIFWCVSSARLERLPVTQEVMGSSPIRTAETC